MFVFPCAYHKFCFMVLQVFDAEHGSLKYSLFQDFFLLLLYFFILGERCRARGPQVLAFPRPQREADSNLGYGPLFRCGERRETERKRERKRGVREREREREERGESE